MTFSIFFSIQFYEFIDILYDYFLIFGTVYSDFVILATLAILWLFPYFLTYDLMTLWYNLLWLFNTCYTRTFCRHTKPGLLAIFPLTILQPFLNYILVFRYCTITFLFSLKHTILWHFWGYVLITHWLIFSLSDFSHNLERMLIYILFPYT